MQRFGYPPFVSRLISKGKTLFSMFSCGFIVTFAKCNFAEITEREGQAGLVCLAFPYVRACPKCRRSLVIFTLHHQYPTLPAQRIHCEELFLLSSFLACVFKTF